MKIIVFLYQLQVFFFNIFLELQAALMDIVFAVVILAAVYVAGSERNWFIVAVLLAIPALAISVFSSISIWPPDTLGYIYLGLITAFIAYATIAVIREVLLADRVTIHTISGAMVGLAGVGAFLLFGKRQLV